MILILLISAYNGPYDLIDDTTTKVQVLNVTSDETRTDDFSDSEDEIPTIKTGNIFLTSHL